MTTPLVVSTQDSLRATADVFSNGRVLLIVVLCLALVGVTILGALSDIDGQSIVAIYSAIIGGAIGHANGNLQGKLAAERDRLLAEQTRLRAMMPPPTSSP